MKEYRFIQVDVFTDSPFGGNPLAVFPEAEGLSTEEMQCLAREMNLSETTFVLPPQAAEADFKVRIFTPAKEVPFAGHPVVGTHWVLAHLGRVNLQEPITQVHFELGVGVLPADLHVSGGQVERVVMTQDRPAFHAVLEDVTELAAGLGLSPEAITETALPVQVVSTGKAGKEKVTCGICGFVMDEAGEYPRCKMMTEKTARDIHTKQEMREALFKEMEKILGHEDE
jgi:trans-2,3-dihydro-3-hydroxyanthranilate isomerase